MKALILSAGEGTRLRPLTLDRPKPMVPIGGRPVLEHLVDLLRDHGVTRIALNLHYKADSIVQHFGDGQRFGVSIDYSWEPRLLGTAGAVRQLDWFLDEPFFVLYGDVLTNVDLGRVAAEHAANAAMATLVLYEPDDLTRCGVAQLGSGGRIVSFVEKPAQPAAGSLANAGVCLFEPDVIDHIPPGRVADFGRDVIPGLIDSGAAVYGHIGDGYLLDIGSPARYEQAQADFAAGRFVPALRQAKPSRSATRVCRC